MIPRGKEMLDVLGLKTVDQLFEDIPAEARVKRVPLPPGLDEGETVRRVEAILDQNVPAGEMLSFLGGGIYDIYVPAIVDAILSRSEFYTSYTPYQAEVSQGLMQGLFEYQSLICELTGMDAANSSMYDASSALGEAALMSHRVTRLQEFIVPRALHPERMAVLRNYVKGAGMRILHADFDPSSGILDLTGLSGLVTEETAGIYVENPNLFGLLDSGLLEIKEEHPNAMLLVGVNPLSLGIVRPPGDYGADIVVGEGQSLGAWTNLGGPSLGIFACRREHLRKLPGRVIGLGRDAKGERAFCMTLQTREQHIRKEKAMSNICTNESLLALGAAVYIAQKGGTGLRRLGVELMRKTKELGSLVAGMRGYTAPLFPGDYFNELPVGLPVSYEKVHRHLLEKEIHGGPNLGSWFPELDPAALMAVTDRHTTGDLARLVSALEEVR